MNKIEVYRSKNQSAIFMINSGYETSLLTQNGLISQIVLISKTDGYTYLQDFILEYRLSKEGLYRFEDSYRCSYNTGYIELD